MNEPAVPALPAAGFSFAQLIRRRQSGRRDDALALGRAAVLAGLPLGQAVIGYFGKIPSHGDFMSRGLPPGLVAAWDQWLTHYLTSPVWRFAISPGILGPEGLGGVMMPSVDRVGRYFPLMIGATGAPPLLDWFRKHVEWYDEIEELARASLDTEFGLEQFDGVAEPGEITHAPFSSMTAMEGRSLWWTRSPPGAEAAVLSCAKMPGSQEFAAMLDGS